MFGRPTRSYAQVEHDADGLGSVAAAPYSLRKEGTFKTYRAHPGHIPHALQSRHARKQAAAEGARAELDQILESGYRPSSRSIHNGSEDQVSPESAGMSRHRTAGGLHAQAESSRMARLRSTASISSFRANGNGGGFGSKDGGGSGKRGVFVDADGRTHDQEYDPFAKHAAESRKKSMSSRRRSAFGGSSTHGHSNGNGGGGGYRDGDSGSETSRSGSDFSDGAASGRYSTGTGAMSGHLGQGLGPARKSIDSSRANAESREEEEIRKRLAMERKRLEGLSGYSALAKRRSVISDRSGQPFAGEGSIRSLADDVDRLTVHSNYTAGQHTQYTAGGRRSVTGYNPSPLSPTFSAGTGRARTNTTSDGGDETPVKSTENTLMPPMSPPQPPSPGTGYFGNGDSNGDRRGSADRSAPVSSDPAYSTKEKSKPLPTEPAPPPKAKVEIKRDGSRKVTGFDAPRSPMPPPPVPAAPANVASGSGTASTHLVQSHIQLQNQQGQMKLDVPASAKSAVSRGSRGSSDRDPREVGDDQSIMSANTSNAAARYRRERPAPRPREEIFPETPAQAKRREEKERRAAARLGPSSASGIGASSGSRGVSSTVIRSSGSNLRAPSAAQAYASSSTGGGMRNHSQLEIDTSLAASTRLLPEIQIVEDDDPRVVIPPTGRSTRVQTVHDHVIRGPFSHALNAQGLSSVAPPSGSGVGAGGMAGIGIGSPTGSARGSRQVSRAGSPSAASVLAGGAAAGARKPSSVNSPFSIGSGTGTVEDRIGYLPSRWASGDKQLRATEEEREMYRPKEWGGRKGELGGRQEDWHPELKDQIKRSWKDVQTNARFSLFRAKKKLGRM